MTRIAISVADNCRRAGDAAEKWLLSQTAMVTCFVDRGAELESQVTQKQFDAVLDLATLELLSVDPKIRDHRLTAAILMGIPQVISVGGLDEATAEQLDAVGKMIVERASAANSPSRILLPIGETAEPMQALFQSIRNWVYPPELLVEVELKIDDPVFGIVAAKLLWQIAGGRP